MKYLILILVLLNTLSAQDREVSKMEFVYKINGTTYTNVPINKDSITPKNYVISTQWGGHPKMLNALKFNYNHSRSPLYGNYRNGVELHYLPNNTETPKLSQIWNFTYEAAAARGFIYEPTLYIPQNKRGEFITKANDSTKAIW